MQRPFLIGLVLTLLAAAEARADLIVGQVVDANGVGVQGVDIDVKNLGSGGDPTPLNDGTDANGFFSTTVPAGTYRVTFNPPPPPASTSLILEIDDVVVSGTKNLGVVPLPPGVALTGRTLTSTGLPVAGVNIDVIDESTGDNLNLIGDTTDAFGDFALAVPAGPIEVRFDATPVVGQTLASRALSLAPGADTALGDVVLPPGFRISTIVLGPGNQPVAFTDTNTHDALTGEKLYTPQDNTDATGFVSVVVPAGSYDVFVCPTVSSGLVAGLVPGLVVTGDVNLGLTTLQAGVVLSGTVRNAQGAALPGVDVDVEDGLTGTKVPLCADNTNGAGAYQVVVPTGTWDVAFTPGYSVPYGSAKVVGVSVGGAKVVNGVLPDCPFSTPYGAGLAGTGALVPQLGSSGGAPRLGNPAWALALSGARGGATAVFLLGFAPAAFPFKQGTLAVDITLPSVLFLVPLPGTPGAAGAGALGLLIPVPQEPALDGFSLFFQFLIQDPAGPAGWALTNGLQVTYCK